MSTEDHGRTTRLELHDQSLREWDATVLASSPEAVVLDRSAFYPGGGGQPPDHGALLWGGVQTRIVGARRGEDLELVPADGDPVPPPGTTVRGAVEDDRRTALMRTHSGLDQGATDRQVGWVPLQPPSLSLPKPHRFAPGRHRGVGVRRCLAGRVAGVLVFGLVLAACSGSEPGGDASSGPSATTSASATATVTVSAAIDALLRERGFTGAVLVRRGRDVLLRRGYGEADGALGSANTPRTRFRIGSVTKQFTAAAVLVLAARGKVGLNHRACRYLPRCPGAWSTISVRHLLTHQSGLPEFLDLPGFDETRPATPEETLATVRRLPLNFAPGTSFSYSNTGYIALGLVIEQASGVDYEMFLQDSFFAPLGMSDSGYEHRGDVPTVGYLDSNNVAYPLDMSVPFAAGGLYSTVDDLARWDAALAGDDILPQDQIAQLWKPEVTDTDFVGLAYGLGEYVGRVDGRRLVIHDGGINGFRSVLARWPDEGNLVVLLSNHEDAPDLQALAQVVAAVI